MSPFDFIKTQIGAQVPFLPFIGVEVTEVADGRGSALLPVRETNLNHIGSQHAGALFTLGETASGAAMTGAVASMLAEVRTLAAGASISYRKVARGAITATARTAEDGEAIRAAIAREGSLRIPVEVTLTDEDGMEVATMKVDWHVKRVVAD